MFMCTITCHGFVVQAVGAVEDHALDGQRLAQVLGGLSLACNVGQQLVPSASMPRIKASRGLMIVSTDGPTCCQFGLINWQRPLLSNGLSLHDQSILGCHVVSLPSAAGEHASAAALRTCAGRPRGGPSQVHVDGTHECAIAAVRQGGDDQAAAARKGPGGTGERRRSVRHSSKAAGRPVPVAQVLVAIEGLRIDHADYQRLLRCKPRSGRSQRPPMAEYTAPEPERSPGGGCLRGASHSTPSCTASGSPS
jgi:hypothetical protein